MCWLLVKNHSEYVTNLEKEAMRPTAPGIAEAMAEQWGCLEKPYEETTQISFEMKEAEA